MPCAGAFYGATASLRAPRRTLSGPPATTQSGVARGTEGNRWARRASAPGCPSRAFSISKFDPGKHPLGGPRGGGRAARASGQAGPGWLVAPRDASGRTGAERGRRRRGRPGTYGGGGLMTPQAPPRQGRCWRVSKRLEDGHGDPHQRRPGGRPGGGDGGPAWALPPAAEQPTGAPCRPRVAPAAGELWPGGRAEGCRARPPRVTSRLL